MHHGAIFMIIALPFYVIFFLLTAHACYFIFFTIPYIIYFDQIIYVTGVFCFFKLYRCHLLWWCNQELNAFLPVNIFQIHFYCYLHFRVSYKDICKRILCSAVFLFERSMELAGLHRHRHGVSIHISDISTRFLTKDYLWIFCFWRGDECKNQII